MINVDFNSKARFELGSILSGVLHWKPDKDLKLNQIVVSLFWRTSGKGDREAEIVARQVVAQKFEGSRGRDHRFEFSLPIPRDAAPTYLGKLLQINWTLQVHFDIPWGLDEHFKCPVSIYPRNYRKYTRSRASEERSA